MGYHDVCFLLESRMNDGKQSTTFKFLLPLIGASILFLVYSIGYGIATSNFYEKCMFFGINIIYIIVTILYFLYKKKFEKYFILITNLLLLLLFVNYSIFNTQILIIVLLLVLLIYVIGFIVIQKKMIGNKMYGLEKYKSKQYNKVTTILIILTLIYSILVAILLIVINKGISQETFVQILQVLFSTIIISFTIRNIFLIPSKDNFSFEDIDNVKKQISNKFPNFYIEASSIPKWQFILGFCALYIPLNLINSFVSFTIFWGM